MKQIRAQIGETTSDYDREKLPERLAKLIGGVAVINVGAATETEMKEKKARVEDALNATRAAVEEGIVPGGGIALVRCLAVLEKIRIKADQKLGVKVVMRAMEEPLRQIAKNAGAEGSVVIDKVKNGEGAFGYNAQTDTYEDLMEAGIMDPTKVVRFPDHPVHINPFAGSIRCFRKNAGGVFRKQLLNDDETVQRRIYGDGINHL